MINPWIYIFFIIFSIILVISYNIIQSLNMSDPNYIWISTKYNNNKYLFFLIIIVLVVSLYNIISQIQIFSNGNASSNSTSTSVNSIDTKYNWIFNSYNNNKYVLLLIILALGLFIYTFNYYKTSADLVNDTITLQLPSQIQQKSNFGNIRSDRRDSRDRRDYYDEYDEYDRDKYYEPPILHNPSHDLFISRTEKEQYEVAKSLLDGNDESLSNTNGSPQDRTQNDILQRASTLFDNNSESYSYNNKKIDTSTIGSYASLDTVGKGLTDTLGGIHTALGYTVLDEQLGTFKKEEIYNDHTYDNIRNYSTGMNPDSVNGNIMNLSSGNKCGNNPPVFLQKDFDGVANIFAPNIIIQNPPLTSDGIPDISLRM